MRVFITGIYGMLGTAIAMRHRKIGDTVTGCDIATSPDDSVYCDIRDEDSLRNMIMEYQPHRIYHCAAMLGVQNTEQQPDLCNQINIDGTRIVAGLAREVGAHLVFLSSSEIYGNQEGLLGEEYSPALGTNVYATGKLAGEHICQRKTGDIQVTICRMFNCYGPHQVRQFFLAKAVDKAMRDEPIYLFGDGNNQRSYLFSFDAAQYIIEMANCDHPSGLVFNIANTDLHTLREAADLVCMVTQSNSEVIVQTGAVYEDRLAIRDIPHRVADTRRLRAMSAHRPIRLPHGLPLFVHAFNTTKADWTYSRVLR